MNESNSNNDAARDAGRPGNFRSETGAEFFAQNLADAERIMELTYGRKIACVPCEPAPKTYSLPGDEPGDIREEMEAGE